MIVILQLYLTWHKVLIDSYAFILCLQMAPMGTLTTGTAAKIFRATNHGSRQASCCTYGTNLQTSGMIRSVANNDIGFHLSDYLTRPADTGITA